MRRSMAIQRAFEAIGRAALAGSKAGFIWGGVGGRVAMRIVALTSGDNVRGVISDDGFEIGRVTFETIALLIFAVVVGTIGGVVHGFLGVWLKGPKWVVASAVGIAVASGVGAMIVKSDGVDFRLLGPIWLTIGLFVLIPGGWGVTVVLLTHRLLGVNPEISSLSLQLPKTRWLSAANTAAWLFLAGITVLGIVDLANDVEALL